MACVNDEPAMFLPDCLTIILLAFRNDMALVGVEGGPGRPQVS